MQVSGVSCLRCSLTGLEINYKVKVPSKQINEVRFYSTRSNPLSPDPVLREDQERGADVDQTQELIMNPWFITGFADAESSFLIRINKNQALSTG